MHAIKTMLFCILWGGSLSLYAQQERLSLSGRIVDPEGTAISYVTVLLKSVADTSSVYGESSDAQGRFLFKVPAGEYSLQTSFLGYSSFNKPITLTSSLDMGDVVIEPVDMELDAVVVQAQMIRREPDRFVVNVGDSPLAAGQTPRKCSIFRPPSGLTISGGSRLTGKKTCRSM